MKARRKFMGAKKCKLGKADKTLSKVQKLYEIESHLKGACRRTKSRASSVCQADTGWALPIDEVPESDRL